MSKGDSPRPFKVSNEEYSSRWDAIFQKNEKKNETQGVVNTHKHNNPRDSGSSDNAQGQTRQTETS
jgi:hypothetical protein